MSQSLDELFLASCGVFGRWSLSVSGPKKAQDEAPFTVPYVLVGSRKDTGLRLKHPDVSRRHAYLQALPGGLFCVDLGSRLGLRFDNQDRLWGWLRTGQRLRVGPFTLELPASNQTSWLATPAWAPPDPIVDHAADNAPLAPVIGTLADGAKVVAEWRMKRVVALVGRSQRCLISVGHTSLSRLHCSLVRTPLGLWVVDLLSRTGTYLNGDPVRCARLREGDRLQVGKYVLRFWYQQSRPKIVVPLAVRSEAPAAPAPAPPPAPAPVEADRALSVPRKGRPTMLQTEPAPPGAMVPTNAGQTLLPDPAGAGGTDRALLAALVGQFDLMQQQMFGQFQESLLMATRLFASLHKEQMAAIHRELADLQGIAAELRTLQEQLTKNAGAAPPAEKPVRNGARPPLPAKADVPAPAGGEEAPAAPPPAAQSEDVHDWLTERIAALETEQQSRWGKLLDVVLGR